MCVCTRWKDHSSLESYNTTAEVRAWACPLQRKQPGDECNPRDINTYNWVVWILSEKFVDTYHWKARWRQKENFI